MSLGAGVDIFSMAGKTVAITGASSGFGSHFAGALAAAGARVVLGARRIDKIAARVEEINAGGGEALGLELDVRDRDSAARFLEEAEAAFGPLDVLVNNAGVESGASTYVSMDEDDWDYVLDTNLKAAWRLCKMYTERVGGRETKGNIVNIASITAYRTIKGQFPYAVSKAGLIKATEIMALEGARYGVRCNAIAPGYILTDVSRVLLESERSESIVKGIPMRRFGEFEDLEGALLLLCSDASAYMSGSTIVVDGGHICAEL
ncbi:SDR family oxidoreductase [Halieaceae bacterium IMCC14734]|uniref:SDR family oxidoreductase n=1 Tax=Candidatus Litorirhabdus singularis TaxID=2518993 RepID=A0ABT3TH57_9GAMM|nr:SDR family oxidoreductase [Candidatus Litorirhabdus singularis]MCX2981653.1 SDR family oxidoreductase [Candidatus Litorirhabdus singularis]